MDFSQLGFLFAAASIFGLISFKFKQPLFLGYLVAGLFLKSIGFIEDSSSLESLGHIGISLLLFLLGLEMNLRGISSVGRPAVIAGVGQIVFSFVLGYFVAVLFGFNNIQSTYIGIALTFSSTIIAVKLISEKDDLESLYGRLAIGILLVQDLVAVLILLFLGSLGSGETVDVTQYGLTFFKGGLVLLAVWYISKKALPNFFEKIAQNSSELLFIVSISWALGFSAFVAHYTGFTLEVGGFIAGLALSGLPEHLQIATKAKPLRDFFLTIYFLILGASLVISGGILSILLKAILLAVVVICSHSLIVLVLLGSEGFKKRTSFFVGTAISQMSEFSLIIASIGLTLGHLTVEITALITLTAIITMTVSTYIISNSDKIFEIFKNYLTYFERRVTAEHAVLPGENLKNHVILVGCDKTGRQLVKYFIKNNIKFLVIDFNPKVFDEMKALGRHVVFGDVNDAEVVELAQVSSSKMVVLTTSNLTDNLTFLECIRHLPNKPVTIFTSTSKNDAVMLYKKGASYVIVPDIVAGDYIKHIFKTFGINEKKGIIKAGKNQLKRLKDI